MAPPLSPVVAALRRTVGVVVVGLPLRTGRERMRLVGTTRGPRLLRRALFDTADYIDRNTDLFGAVSDPYLHFHSFGWAEGRPARMIDLDGLRAARVTNDVDSAHASETLLDTAARCGALVEVTPRRRSRPRTAPSDQFSSRYRYVPPSRSEGRPESNRSLLISIVVRSHDHAPARLERMLACIDAQWHAAWELVVVDDASRAATTRRWLDQLAAERSPDRVRVLFRASSGGVSVAWNEGVAASRGDVVVFLEADDLLSVDCLDALVNCVVVEGAAFVYSDEDLVGADGVPTSPHFKPDWSPDTLLSLPYVGRVMGVRREVWERAGGFRPETDGCHEWDFALRVTELGVRIGHVPKILYHKNIYVPDPVEACRRSALSVRIREEALVRRSEVGRLEPVAGFPGRHRVVRDPPAGTKASIIIPSRDNGPVLERCIESVSALTTHVEREVIVIDNGSRVPSTLALLERLRARAGHAVLRMDEPFNFSRLCNAGARAASGRVLVFLNDDTEVLTPDWLERLSGFAVARHVGAAGAKLLYPRTGRIQHCGVVSLRRDPQHAHIGRDDADPGYFFRNQVEYDWAAVTGACLAVEAAKFEAVGGFDESFPIAYNDLELCFRLVEAGLFNVVSPGVRLLHHESVTRGADVSAAKMARLKVELGRLFEKHPQFHQRDPWFNPNFAPDDVHFRVVRP